MYNKGTDGTNLDERLHVVNKIYFPKNKGNAFSNPGLNAYLKSKNAVEIFIGGLYAEACIHGTLKVGLKQNYKINILTDCIATKSEVLLSSLALASTFFILLQFYRMFLFYKIVFLH